MSRARFLESQYISSRGKHSEDALLTYHFSPFKPSRPARAYLHVFRREDLAALSELVRVATWEDAKETWTSASLIGPPAAEFATYKKIPSGRRRTDNRQGTIDQDPEFMDFLEALANPAAGEGEQTTEEDSKGGGKATTTPLIDYLREKKANKAREAAGTKAAKHARHESQTGKGKEDSKRKSKESRSDKPTDKHKETVKILTKKAAAEAADAAKSAAGQIAASKEDVPRSRRAGIAAAARILQRDLGLSPGNAHRRARQQAAQAESVTKVTAVKENGSAAPAAPRSPTTLSQPSTPTAPKAQLQAQTSSSRGSRGKKATAPGDSKGKSVAEKSETPHVAPTKILQKKKDDPTPAAAATGTPPTGPKATQTKAALAASAKKTSAAAPTPGATRGFVKHANPSQGVTEALLKEAMETFGGVTFVEIDRRKGFAYVDFAEHEGLSRAIAATPIAVAQAAVQVLERKDREAKKAPAALAPATSNGGSSTASAASPTALAADNKSASGAAEHKRGGRRRGRGRGDGQAKENGAAGGGGKGHESTAAVSAPPSALPPTAVTSAG